MSEEAVPNDLENLNFKHLIPHYQPWRHLATQLLFSIKATVREGSLQFSMMIKLFPSCTILSALRTEKSHCQYLQRVTSNNPFSSEI